MILFDSHCHLQDERFATGIDSVIGRARAAGVGHILCCGSAESDWERVQELAAHYPEIVPAFGLHPWYVKARSPGWLEGLERMLVESPGAAVGEIGLDHALEERNDRDQAEVFLDQLKLARRLRRPVSIHCRRAFGDLMEILTAQCGLPDGGAVHSFSGPADLIPQLQKLNVSLSFSGSITHDRNKRGRTSAAAVSDEFLLIETDSPDLSPAGVAPGDNEPAHLIAVAEALAVIRGGPVENISDITTRNARRIFLKT